MSARSAEGPSTSESEYRGSLILTEWRRLVRGITRGPDEAELEDPSPS